MNDTLGIIMAGLDDTSLGELTKARSLAAMPVAGRYRLIDFVLSNLVNSGITNVGVPTLSYYRSLMDHLGGGKEWDLNRKVNGLFILPPYLGRGFRAEHAGDLDVLNGILDYLTNSRQRYVILTGCDALYNTTYEPLRAAHIASGADITVLGRRAFGDGAFSPNCVSMSADHTGRVTDMQAGSAYAVSGDLLSMGVYFMEKSYLEYQIVRCVSRGMHDFVMDVLIRGLQGINLHALEYSGHVGRIDSVGSYYFENMRLLDPDVYAELFNSDTPIYTKVKDQVPTIYGKNAHVRNSIIADGCIINGTVENSIVLRGVQVEENAQIYDSVVMQNSTIQQNVYLKHAVLDKNVVIRYSKRLVGQDSFPVVIGKGVVI